MESLFVTAMKLRGKFGLDLHRAIAILVLLVALLLILIFFAVWRQTSFVTAVCVDGIAILAIWKRLREWPGYGTPPLPNGLRDDERYKKGEMVRVVVLSDTHDVVFPKDFDSFVKDVPEGDILLHCGDITKHGELAGLRRWNEICGLLKGRFQAIVSMCGNHCIAGDVACAEHNIGGMFQPNLERWQKHDNDAEFRKLLLEPLRGKLDDKEAVRRMLHEKIFSNSTHYLENDVVEIEVKGKGTVRIAGTPTTSFIPGGDTYAAAFTGDLHHRRLEQMMQKIVKERQQIDIFMSHGPPRFKKKMSSLHETGGECPMDKTFLGMHVGLHSLSKWISKMHRAKIAPKFFCSGHIHETRGAWRVRHSALDGADDKDMSAAAMSEPIDTTFVSAASVNLLYQLRPGKECAVVFDVDVNKK